MRYLPMKLRLPGVCVVCRRPVIFDGKRWKDSNVRFASHVCPPERIVCGAWMPRAQERCARAVGHRFEHRSRYAMDNALQMATGRAA